MGAGSRKPVITPFWRNILIVIGAVTVAIVVIIPTVYFEYYEKRNSSASQLAKVASQYTVINHNFADPSLIRVGDTLYAFATRSIRNTTLNVQVATAAVARPAVWTLQNGYDALPRLPSWAGQRKDASVWAPQPVFNPATEEYVLYFAAPMLNHSKKHCLGTATSRNVLGPYTPSNSTTPLLCHFNEGGIIDPAFLQDPLHSPSSAPTTSSSSSSRRKRRSTTTSSNLLIYKNDGNGIGTGGACANSIWPNAPTAFQYEYLTLSLTAFSADYVSQTAMWTNNTAANYTSSTDPSITPQSNATIFLRNSRVDGANIESPQLWYRATTLANGTLQRAYHLLYNSGCFTELSYRINYLQCVVDGSSVRQFTDCPWQRLKQDFDASSRGPLLETGVFEQLDANRKKTQVHLYAPGGPGVADDGTGRTLMVFHADLNPVWFGDSLNSWTDRGRKKHSSRGLVRRTDAGGDPANGKDRTRGMFVAELGYSSATGEVYIKEILPPMQ